MIEKTVCYCVKCGIAVEGFKNGEVFNVRLCDSCTAARVKEMHDRTDQCKSAEELGLAGQQGDYGGSLLQQMRSNGRRVIRKAEPMGG